MVERRLTGMIAAAAVLIVLFIFWDAFRPDVRPLDSEPPPVVPVASDPSPLVQPQPPASVSQGSAVTAGREPTYVDLLARSETRRRIRASGTSTYLGEMLAQSDDSILRRWENRTTNPIRVWFAPTYAANFKPVGPL